ncbi:pyruvate kinase [Adhaeribacter aquaticus]|uniref:pyruvate kinase n=1 Tax=Adhaeribacter aquaticus TaxID=299567 RepID=UPI000416FFED|nr:pyruvate kinase [Adhaeribacter aquaticus]
MEVTFNKTKIIATVGPASNNHEMLTALVKEGVDVFRLNFSHGKHEDHAKVVSYVRQINQELGTTVCLMQDLQGPKIRLGDVENGQVEIHAGDKIKLVCDNSVSTATRLSTVYTELARDVNPGDAILIDDGKIELRVISTDKDKEVEVVVIYGGPVKPRKGINLPDTAVSAPSLTEKDKEDLHFGLDNNVEWVALSFVRRAEDIVDIKRIIAERGKNTMVVAKIEKPEAIKNIDEIIAATDAIMVARGDLGVEIKAEDVPMLQKMIIGKCNKAGKPVIVATQMMESMITNARPTRAETNDVANAVIDGADAVMLSAETAAGAYPLETIRSMSRTIASVESHGEVFNKISFPNNNSGSFFSKMVIAHACTLARDTDAKAIVCMTRSGYTAFNTAKHRPKASIFAFTDSPKLLNQLNMVWGVRALLYEQEDSSTDNMLTEFRTILTKQGFLETGDVVVNITSMPVTDRTSANTIKLSRQ